MAPPRPLRIHPLTPARWPDLVRLFGDRGACAGCWCMAWRVPKRQWEAQRGASNRRAFRRVVARGPAPGVLAYVGNEPAGWCAIAPRPVYVALERSRVLAPVDERPVWSVSCFFIERSHRRQGLGTALLEAAVALARRLGAAIVEGYPVEPRKGWADVFAWTGTTSMFLKAGFVEVARRSPGRPVMRRELGPPRARPRSRARRASAPAGR